MQGRRLDLEGIDLGAALGELVALSRIPGVSAPGFDASQLDRSAEAVAALLRDMKRRGLLEDTLVVWTTEFGRMPMFQAGTYGRDHNPLGFTCWLAGAGVKPGYSYGATDDFGYRAEENVVTPHDFHATILHLMGLDHERLTYRFGGRDYRLTDVHGRVVKDVLA